MSNGKHRNADDEPEETKHKRTWFQRLFPMFVRTEQDPDGEEVVAGVAPLRDEHALERGGHVMQPVSRSGRVVRTD